MLLKEKSPQKAADYVRQYIADVKTGKVPYGEFIIWKTLTKAPEEYAVKAPHVEAARLLKKEGLDLTLGDKVGYVIVEGEGKLYAKAKPYMLASKKNLDITYYITNQIVPAAARILGMFGIKEEELYATKPKTSLTEFFTEKNT
jgi:DNA polymerase I